MAAAALYRLQKGNHRAIINIERIHMVIRNLTELHIGRSSSKFEK